jgi:hypothetical protein
VGVNKALAATHAVNTLPVIEQMRAGGRPFGKLRWN